MDIFFPNSNVSGDESISSSISCNLLTLSDSEIPLYSASRSSGTISYSVNVKTSFRSREEVKVRCPLCNNKTSIIYCTDCINSGKFSHRNDVTCGDRYMDMRVNEVRLRGKMQLLKQDILRLEDTKRRGARMLSKIDQQRRKNQLMKKVLQEEKENVIQLRRQCAKIDSSIDHQRKVNIKWRASMTVSKGNIGSTASKAQLYSKELQVCRRRVNSVTRSHINDLLRCIIPVQYLGEHVSPGITGSVESLPLLEDPDNSMLESSYRGPKPQPLYSVGDLLLPGTGSLVKFRATHMPVGESTQRVMCPRKNTEMCQTIQVTAALLNTTLLVNILATLMNVTLPHRLTHGDFNEPYLPESQLSSLITKLNVNLIYFCLAAGAKKLYHHNHTMKNLMVLLNHVPITRDCMSITVPDELHESVSRLSGYLPYVPSQGCNYLSTRSYGDGGSGQHREHFLLNQMDNTEQYLSEYDIVNTDEVLYPTLHLA